MITKIINGNVIASGMTQYKSVYFKDEKIIAVTNDELYYDKLIDAQNHYVSAGFIDIHTHGDGGHDFMDGGVQPIIEAATLHLQHGTTTVMPTTLASSYNALQSTMQDMQQAMKLYPNIIGMHLEGPYFSPVQAGAQNPKYITPPIKEEYENLLALSSGIIKRWSFAPELEGSVEFCKALIQNNIVPSIAHSDAVYEDVLKVYQLGCRLVTHLYSGMSTIKRVDGYRRLGVVEAAYLLDDMTVEVIADGVHLPPELLRMIYKIKGADQICLVTDSMRGAGMPDGLSLLGMKDEGMPCIIEDGVAKLLDRSAFAGSVATADRLIRTFVRDVGVSVENAVKMMTETPAKVFKLKNKGIIQEGFDADIVIFDENISVRTVISLGKIVL